MTDEQRRKWRAVLNVAIGAGGGIAAVAFTWGGLSLLGELIPPLWAAAVFLAALLLSLGAIVYWATE